MNVIVSNKQKNILDNANIDAIKDLNGLFNVDELINNFKDYFFSKMIIDATAIVDFASEGVLRKLVNGIGAEKILLLLPNKPDPPRKFCELLISLGLYNFSTDINDILKYLVTPNTLGDAERILNGNYDASIYEATNMAPTPDNSVITDNMMNNNDLANNSYNNNNHDNVNNASTIMDNNRDNKIVIGFKNVTMHAGSTTLIYMIKKELEESFNITCDAFEIGGSDFALFNTKGMNSINNNNVEATIKNCSSRIILVDLNRNNYEALCDEVLYLIEPSIIGINKLLFEKRNAFSLLNDKKVILNKCMLNASDIDIFAKEAGLKIYYSVPFVNDRVSNKVIKNLIEYMGINGNGSKGFLGLFR